MHDACRVFPDGTGSYDLAIKAAKHYRKYYDAILSSKMTLSPDNINFVFPALVNLWENDYNFIYCNCVYEKGWTIEHARVLYNELKNKGVNIEWINDSPYTTNQRKIIADKYIDDRAFGGITDWDVIEEHLC